MPLEMVDDPGGQPEQNNQSARRASSGGGGGNLFALLPMLFSLFRGGGGGRGGGKGGLVLLLLVLGGGYFLLRSGGCEGGLGGALPGMLAKFATGGRLDPNEFKKASVYEPLEEDNKRNPLPESVSLLKYAPKRLNQGEQGSCVA